MPNNMLDLPNKTETIKGRFAPSPSGYMHLGNAWTALLAWLQVRSLGGVMVLRMEDLDPDRCRPEYGQQMMADMRWLGLDWDEGPDVGGDCAPYNQNERRDLYDWAVEKLRRQNLIYPCYCTRAELQAIARAPHDGEPGGCYPGTCHHLTEQQRQDRQLQRKPYSLRLKASSAIVTYQDLVRGMISENVALTCGDFVIRRSDGVHAYQLAVVVDDGLMNITHVLRGDDLLSSTPRQLLLYSLLGMRPPQFAHVPLLYGKDGYRLSKRQQGVSIAELRTGGTTAEQIIGYLAYHAGLIDKQEPVRASELVSLFDLHRLPDCPLIVDASWQRCI